MSEVDADAESWNLETDPIVEEGNSKPASTDIDIDRLYCHSDVRLKCTFWAKFWCKAPLMLK